VLGSKTCYVNTYDRTSAANTPSPCPSPFDGFINTNINFCGAACGRFVYTDAIAKTTQEHNISHVSLSSELLAVKMPQLHRPDPRILRVLRTTDRNLTRCQDNHQRNGRQNCIGPVLAFTHSARRPRPQAPTFPIPPPTPSRNCLPICFVHMEMKWQTRMRAEVEQGK